MPKQRERCLATIFFIKVDFLFWDNNVHIHFFITTQNFISKFHERTKFQNKILQEKITMKIFF
jgi:hypothetical protein